MIIGISAGRLDGAHRVVQSYTACIAANGAIPLIIPVTTDEDTLRRTLRRVDALLMIGGGDIHPCHWGETLLPESNTPDPIRDAYDLALARIAYQLSIPTLGICRGMQAMNVAFGGDIYQDIYSQQPDAHLLQHSQSAARCATSHPVDITPGSLLNIIVGADTLPVNSFHHQAIRRVADGWIASATAPDGTIEAIEHTHYTMIGVQWHPEELFDDDSRQNALFRWLLTEADIYHRARQIHNETAVVDTHTDTPMVWSPDTDLSAHHDENTIKVDFRKCADADLGALFMVAYLPQTAHPSDTDYHQRALEAHHTAIDTIRRLRLEVERHPDLVCIGKDYDIKKHSDEPRTQIYFGLENGFALAGSIDNVNLFYDLGVRYITLCHNGDNDLCDSARGTGTHGGLSDFGKEVIRSMNNLGMMVDVSHASDATIRQAIKYSKSPVIATHTSAHALCQHPRNMTDDTIRLLAQSGGHIHVCLYDYFLRNGGGATIDDIVAHILHLVKVAGIDHVGIGSDFDGGGGVPGCNDESQLINITTALLRHGMKPDEVKKIMGTNFNYFFSRHFPLPF